MSDEAVAAVGPLQEIEENIEDSKDDKQLIEEAANAPKPNILAQQDEGSYEPSDVFAWSNNLYQYKDQLQIELFLINKNSVMYSVKLQDELKKQLQPLFITNILEYVLNGAAEGLVVRSFEEAEAEENVLQRTRWKNVDQLAEVMHWIRTQEQEIVQFVEEEHDLKRIKAVMARCSHPAMAEPFYVIKALPRAQMMKGQGAWMVSGKVFMPFEDAVALRIPADNQLLIIGQDLFVFSQPKLRTLFGYDAKKNSIAEKKVAAIQSKYNLSFPDGEDMQTMVKGNKPLINKLQKLELTNDLKQEDILDHGDGLGVDLMCDETGAIIIENPKDLSKFINLLNDDYVESNLTGVRYEIKSKRLLKPAAPDSQV
jgi:Kiwa KwaB-like protein